MKLFQDVVSEIDTTLIGEDFQAEVLAGNTEMAERLLLDYYRNRKNISFFFDKDNKDKLINYNNKLYKDEIQAIIYRADRALEHKFILRGNSIDTPFVFVGDDINWNVTPNSDREGLFSLNIQAWFLDMAKAYWYTNDEKYTKGFIELLCDWYKKCPCPNDGKEHFWDYSGWRSLEASRRMKYFIHAYYMFQDSPYWTPELNTMFIHLVYQHCSQLAEHICILDHNHTIMHMEGLLYGAIFFSELCNAKHWIEVAQKTLEVCAKEQINGDGVHIEAVPAYHNHCVMLFAKPMLFGDINGYPLSDNYRQLVRNMFEFSMYTFRPDGSCTPIGDSDTISNIPRGYIAGYGYYVLGLNELAPFAEINEELSWLVLNINQEKKAIQSKNEPASLQTSKAFYDGGYYCFQSDWRENAHYSMFHCGPLVHGHPHADLLSMDIFAYGNSLLTDVGIFTYNECTDRKYLKGTQAHNTITIDGCDQAEYDHRMGFKNIPNYKLNKFEITNQYAFVDAEHYGYHRLDDSVTHRRQFLFIDHQFYIVIDTLLGNDEHDIEQFWHFNSNNAEMSPDGLEVRSNDRNQANIQIIPVVTSNIKGEVFESWLSDKYGSKRKAEVARYWIKGQLPMSLVTLLIPEEAHVRKTVKILNYNHNEENISLNIMIDSKEYTIVVEDTIKVVVKKEKGDDSFEEF